MSRAEQNILKYNQEETITFPSKEGEAKLAIRRADWNRIKRLISNIPPITNIYQIVYSILFSIAGAVAISLHPIYTNPDAAAWIFPLYMWLAIFAFVVAVIFCILGKTMHRTRTNYIQNIQEDIDEIEQTFEAGSDELEALSETSDSDLEIINHW